jgi:hypothetical protein
MATSNATQIYTSLTDVAAAYIRVCDRPLISRWVAAAVENSVQLDEIGDLALKGLMQAVVVYNVATQLSPSGATEQ